MENDMKTRKVHQSIELFARVKTNHLLDFWSTWKLPPFLMQCFPLYAFFGATFTVKHLFNNCGGVVLVFWTSKEKNTSRRCFQLPSFLIRFSWAVVFFFKRVCDAQWDREGTKMCYVKFFGAEGSMANCNALGNGWGKRCMCACKVKNLRSWCYLLPSWSNIVCINFKKRLKNWKKALLAVQTQTTKTEHVRCALCWKQFKPILVCEAHTMHNKRNNGRHASVIGSFLWMNKMKLSTINGICFENSIPNFWSFWKKFQFNQINSEKIKLKPLVVGAPPTDRFHWEKFNSLDCLIGRLAEIPGNKIALFQVQYGTISSRGINQDNKFDLRELSSEHCSIRSKPSNRQKMCKNKATGWRPKFPLCRVKVESLSGKASEILIQLLSLAFHGEKMSVEGRRKIL